MPKQKESMEEKFRQAEAEVEARYKNFDPKRLTEESKGLHSVFVKGMGTVKFGALSFRDIMEIDKASGDNIQDKGIRFVHVMLKKAYPDLTYEDVLSWDSVKVADIMLGFQKAGFFQPQPR